MEISLALVKLHLYIETFYFSVKRSDYRIHFWHMSKDDAINLMKNSNLNEKRGLL